jgi:hypothetical protein
VNGREAGSVNDGPAEAGAGGELGAGFSAGASLRRTTGRAPELPPVRRTPPIGPSLNPNEARPGPPGEAGPNSGAGVAAGETEEAGGSEPESADDRECDVDRASEADRESGVEPTLECAPNDARAPEGRRLENAPEGADSASGGAAGVEVADDEDRAGEREPCRGGIVVRARLDVRLGRPGVVAGTNGLGRNDSSSAETDASPLGESCAPALNHPPAGASVGASGIVAPGRR